MIKTYDIKITYEMLSIISEVDEFKLTWKLLGKMTPKRLKELKKVATIKSVGSSNRIEGNKLSDNEVEKLCLQSVSNLLQQEMNKKLQVMQN